MTAEYAAGVGGEALVRCPEHGEPLEVTGDRHGGMFYHSWQCPRCPSIRRCGMCGKAAPEAWQSGRCHGCYRESMQRLAATRAEQREAARQAELDRVRQAAADAVLAAARGLCCGDNPAPHHAATDAHSQRMAFAEELARAVRGS